MLEFIDLPWHRGAVRIECRWIRREQSASPLIVFLHEGLGSVAMWKDFPDRLCERVGARGLVYSRPGYGLSSPPTPTEDWDVDFLHQQANEVLPLLLETLGMGASAALAAPLWLVGHSDGGSIALIYAASHPGGLSGAIVLAPHTFVEDLTVASISQARDAYQQTDLPQKLGRYHDDPDRAFWRWNRIWLKPAFLHWSITEEIASIRCPILAVQGQDDVYGTMAQIRSIAHQVPGTQLLELGQCGHSPHRDQPEVLLAAATAFIGRHT